jgi:hypothetical protein
MAIDRDLINLLLTHAGMVMEDAHDAAVIGDGDLTIEARIAAVRYAGAAIVTFADAAGLLQRSAETAQS